MARHITLRRWSKHRFAINGSLAQKRTIAAPASR